VCGVSSSVVDNLDQLLDLVKKCILIPEASTIVLGVC